MDILYLRFANTILEPVWNRQYVDSRADHDGRGLRRRGPRQLLRPGRRAARRRPEPPAAGARAGGDGAALGRARRHRRRSATARTTSSARCPRPTRAATSAASTSGYREIDGVAPDSETETFVALRLEVDNWRWAGVPFFIRAGKALPVEATEVRVVFKRPPRLGIGGRMVPDPDELIIRIKPEPGAEICLMAKKAGEDELQRVHLDLLFEQQVGEQPEPYERLLRDALRGDSQLFPDFDAIDETWRIVQPLLDDPPRSSLRAGPRGQNGEHLLRARWRRCRATGSPTTASPACRQVRVVGATSGGAMPGLAYSSNEERGADRAAEVAELGDLDRRAGGRRRTGAGACALAIFSAYGSPKRDAEPAAEDDRLDVEQVDRRGDPGAERLVAPARSASPRARRRGRAPAPRSRW